MNGEEFEIKTKSIDITEKWQIDLNQPNVKKDNEINDGSQAKDWADSPPIHRHD